MSLALYDTALLNKIKEVFSNVVNADESSAFSESIYNDKLDIKENFTGNSTKITLPLISFWRTSNNPNMEEYGNYVSVLKGKGYSKGYANEQRIRTFPVNINYQVSIWSDTRREVDEIFREFCLLFFVDEPYLTIRVADSEFTDSRDNNTTKQFIIDEQFSLILVDSSTEIDTSSFTDRGRIYRQDIMIEIPNAKMFYLGKDVPLVLYIDNNIESIE